MRKFKEFHKILALVLAALVIMIPSGCYSIRQSIPRNDIKYSGKPYYYIHGNNTEYPITSLSLSDGVLSGKIVDTIYPLKKNQVVNVYIAPDSVINITRGYLKVPMANIAKAEIFKSDAGTGITVFITAATAAWWSALLIILLTKGASCPFVYSENTADINLEGEIYSGASATPIERDDYLKLKSISPVDDQYRIRITNEVKEIQNTNLAELLVLDHPNGSEIIVDKYGTAHSVSAIQKPLEASDAYGRSIIEELSGIDDIRYLSDIKNDELVFDTISLSFEKPENSTNARLILSGKNTMWLDYMFGRFSDLFGRRHDEWKERRNSRTREELVQWTLDQGIPLAVWLEKDSGLEFADYFNVPGPVIDKKDVLKIDLSGISGNRVNVKLISGVLFWDIDFAGMDFTAVEEPLKNRYFS